MSSTSSFYSLSTLSYCLLNPVTHVLFSHFECIADVDPHPSNFFFSLQHFCSCTNLWLLKFQAYWDPSFGHTVFLRTYFAIPEGEGWYSTWQWTSAHPHWEHRPFSAAVMCWGWGTGAVWRLCMQSYPPPHGLCSMQMAPAMLRLAVSMSGAREQCKACRVYPNPNQLLPSYGTLMDTNNGFNCGPACVPGPWNSSCNGKHVYKAAGFVPIRGFPQFLEPHAWFWNMPFSAMGCLGLCGHEWSHLAHFWVLVAAFGPAGVQHRLWNPYYQQSNNQKKQVNQILKPHPCCYTNCCGWLWVACCHWKNLSAAAMSALPSSRPLCTSSMVSSPMTTELCWGSSPGVFHWGLCFSGCNIYICFLLNS